MAMHFVQRITQSSSSHLPSEQRKPTMSSMSRWMLVILSIAWLAEGFQRQHQQNHHHHAISTTQRIPLPISIRLFLHDDDFSIPSSPPSSSFPSFAMDPTAEEARRIIRDTLQLSAEQHQQLAKLAVLVKDWNTRINLISRKDCSRDVVFGRHILPSLAPLALLSKEGGLQLQGGQQVCDVGTGGGFPGLPLAIARPDVDFLLVDSVGKKLTVVQDMADQLGLENVQIYHGRAESVPKDQKFDWVMGRSVAAIPTYCFWIDHLLKKKNQNEPDSCGHLLYLIGGDIDDSILEKSIRDEHISDLLERADVSDKRVLVFPQPAVHQLAQSSGEKLKVPQGSRDRSQHGNHQKKIANRRKNNSITTARGQWQQRDVTAPKQRGYEGFERFDSIQK